MAAVWGGGRGLCGCCLEGGVFRRKSPLEGEKGGRVNCIPFKLSALRARKGLCTAREVLRQRAGGN